MKKLALSLLAAVLFMSACKKDDDAPASSFTFSGNTVATPFGYKVDNGQNGREMIFSNASFSDTTAKFFNAFIVDIDTLIDGASYSFLDKEAAAFDKTKNFYGSSVAYKVEIKDRETVDTTGIWLENPTKGTVTVKKSGESFTIGYSVEYPTGKVAGTYIGKLTPVQ